MEIRNLGRSGLRVSLVGLGCNNFGGRIEFEASKAVVHRALDLGITLLDTVGLSALARRLTETGSVQALERLNLDGLLALWHPLATN